MTKLLGNQNLHSFVACFKELIMALENHEKYQDAQGKSTWIVKSVAPKTRNTFNAQLFATLGIRKVVE